MHRFARCCVRVLRVAGFAARGFGGGAALQKGKRRFDNGPFHGDRVTLPEIGSPVHIYLLALDEPIATASHWVMLKVCAKIEDEMTGVVLHGLAAKAVLLRQTQHTAVAAHGLRRQSRARP